MTAETTATLKEETPFELGDIILPALDGKIAQLGFDIEELNDMGLGIVIEEGKHRLKCFFPELKLNIFLNKEEIKVIHPEEYNFPNLKVTQIQKLTKKLNARYILDIEKNTLEELWEDPDPETIQEFYTGERSQTAIKLSLGLEEFKDEIWNEVKQELQDEILFVRHLPSGMHKIDFCIYLKA